MPSSIACDRVRLKLQEHLEGLLMPLDRAAVEAHLERCAACRRERASWTALVASLERLPEAEVPAGFAESVVSDLDEMLPAQEGAGHVVRWGVIVAALVSAGLASVALLVNEAGPEVTRETLQPLLASLQLGGLIVAQVAAAAALGLAAMSEAVAAASLPAKAACVLGFAAINAALIATLARLRPVHGASLRARR